VKKKKPEEALRMRSAGAKKKYKEKKSA